MQLETEKAKKADGKTETKNDAGTGQQKKDKRLPLEDPTAEKRFQLNSNGPHAAELTRGRNVTEGQRKSSMTSKPVPAITPQTICTKHQRPTMPGSRFCRTCAVLPVCIRPGCQHPPMPNIDFCRSCSPRCNEESSTSRESARHIHSRAADQRTLLDELRAWAGGLERIGDTERTLALLVQNEVSMANLGSFSVDELATTGIGEAAACELLSQFKCRGMRG